jgi:hypothetical protein
MRRLSAAFLLLAISAPASAQVIQLPSFHSFSVDTTVVVPDSGPAPLADQRTARTGRSQAGGLPGARAIGRDRQRAGANVQAQIHDPLTAEGDLAEQARASRAIAQRLGTSRSETIAPRQGGASSRIAAVDPAVPSVAEIKRARAAQHAQGTASVKTHPATRTPKIATRTQAVRP